MNTVPSLVTTQNFTTRRACITWIPNCAVGMKRNFRAELYLSKKINFVFEMGLDASDMLDETFRSQSLTWMV